MGLNWRSTAFAIGVLVPVIAFWPVLVAGTRTFYALLDQSQAFYPFFQKEAVALHRGYLPLWDANIESGYSFAGDVGTAIFYPLNLIFVEVFGSSSGIAVWYLELLVVVHFCLAFAGMYLYARRLDFEPPAAIVSALLFSYAGPHAFRAVYQESNFATASLIPFAAYFAVCFARSGRMRYALLAGIIIGLEILAGHFAAPLQSVLVCAALLAGAQVFVRYPKRLALGIVLVGLGLLVVGAPALFFGFQRFNGAYRFNALTPTYHLAAAKLPFSAIDVASLPVTGLLSFFAVQYRAGYELGNSLFMGILPSATLILTLSNRAVLRNMPAGLRMLAPLYLLGGASALIALGGATPVGRVWYLLPFVDTLIREPGRYTMIVAFAIATLTGHAVSASLRARDTADRRRPGVWCAILLALLVAFLTFFTQAPGISLAFVVIAVLVFTLSHASSFPRLIVAMFVVETTLVANSVPLPVSSRDYAATLWKNSSVYAAPERCYPACRVSVANRDNAIPINLGDVFPVQLTTGYSALGDRNYVDFLTVDSSHVSFRNDLLNVRYVLSTRPLAGLRLVAEDMGRGYYLYERSTEFPRVYSLQAAVERKLSLNDVTFTIEHYDDLSQIFRVSVPRPEVVVFSELFYQGWGFSVDGKRARPSVANIGFGPAIFRAVALTRGEHVVAFSYPMLDFARPSVLPPSL